MALGHLDSVSLPSGLFEFKFLDVWNPFRFAQYVVDEMTQRRFPPIFSFVCFVFGFNLFVFDRFVSLFVEPPDIKNWFSSYIYESPELDASDGFQDSDGAGESCPGEESNGKSGNRVGGYDDACAAQLKLSHGVESESLSFSAGVKRL